MLKHYYLLHTPVLNISKPISLDEFMKMGCCNKENSENKFKIKKLISEYIQASTTEK